MIFIQGQFEYVVQFDCIVQQQNKEMNQLNSQHTIIFFHILQVSFCTLSFAPSRHLYQCGTSTDICDYTYSLSSAQQLGVL